MVIRDQKPCHIYNNDKKLLRVIEIELQVVPKMVKNKPEIVWNEPEMYHNHKFLAINFYKLVHLSEKVRDEQMMRK